MNGSTFTCLADECRKFQWFNCSENTFRATMGYLGTGVQAGLLYTGADDCKFKSWDSRDTSSPVFCVPKVHTGGVCCIQSNPHRECEVATGSYDECARLWDLRRLEAPLETRKVPTCYHGAVLQAPAPTAGVDDLQQTGDIVALQVETGGGVWRLKWHPCRDDVALLACMQNGFAITSFAESGWTWTYPHQKVLAYGADWWHVGEELCAATCSFYDRSLHVWCCPELGGSSVLGGSSGVHVKTACGLVDTNPA
jgi:diphthine methyl ester acylhydrolase